MDIGDRIKVVRDKFELSQAEFGEKLSLERSAVSLMERGLRNVTERTIKDICREFNISLIWLKEGIGDMCESSDMETTALFDRIMAGENETAKALFKAFAKLNDDDWAVIQKVIDEVKKQSP